MDGEELLYRIIVALLIGAIVTALLIGVFLPIEDAPPDMVSPYCLISNAYDLGLAAC